MIEYAVKYYDKLISALMEHLQMMIITLVFSVLIAAALTLGAILIPAIAKGLIYFFSVIYAIPSLAMFALLIPVTGLGRTTAIFVLILYNQYLLLRNFMTGLNEVAPSIMEAATGIGMSKLQRLYKVQLPLAKKSLFTGVRISIVSTVGISTIAASINAGGLGSILFDGLRTMNISKIIWGSILSAGLAILLNGLLRLAEKKLK